MTHEFQSDIGVQIEKATLHHFIRHLPSFFPPPLCIVEGHLKKSVLKDLKKFEGIHRSFLSNKMKRSQLNISYVPISQKFHLWDSRATKAVPIATGSLHLAPSLRSFRQLLKTELFQTPFSSITSSFPVLTFLSLLLWFPFCVLECILFQFCCLYCEIDCPKSPTELSRLRVDLNLGVLSLTPK